MTFPWLLVLVLAIAPIRIVHAEPRDPATRVEQTFDVADFYDAARTPNSPEPGLRKVQRGDVFGSAAPSRDRVLEELARRIIIDHVDTGSWHEAGGESAEITVEKQSLRVMQFPENLPLIESLLAQLRKPEPWNKRPAATQPRADAAGRITRVYDIRSLPVAASGITALTTRAQAVDDLIERIGASVDPQSWRDQGGMVGLKTEWGGRLIVTQTEQNHEKLRELLKQWTAR